MSGSAVELLMYKCQVKGHSAAQTKILLLCYLLLESCRRPIAFTEAQVLVPPGPLKVGLTFCSGFHHHHHQYHHHNQSNMLKNRL